MTARKKQARSRLTREDWIRAAIAALRRGGNNALTIAALARTLGVTTGSFHWHFADKKAFRDEILDYWLNQMIRGAGEQAVRVGKGPEQIKELVSFLAERGLPEVDAAIRHWAGSDEVVAAAVARADGFRIRRLSGMLQEAGFDEQAAVHRARMLLWLHVGSIGLKPDLRRGTLAEFVKMLLRDPKRRPPVSA